MDFVLRVNATRRQSPAGRSPLACDGDAAATGGIPLSPGQWAAKGGTMASDITLAVGDGARRMTYAELAQARAISLALGQTARSP